MAMDCACGAADDGSTETDNEEGEGKASIVQEAGVFEVAVLRSGGSSVGGRGRGEGRRIMLGIRGDFQGGCVERLGSHGKGLLDREGRTYGNEACVIIPILNCLVLRRD